MIRCCGNCHSNLGATCLHGIKILEVMRARNATRPIDRPIERSRTWSNICPDLRKWNMEAEKRHQQQKAVVSTLFWNKLKKSKQKRARMMGKNSSRINPGETVTENFKQTRGLKHAERLNCA